MNNYFDFLMEKRGYKKNEYENIIFLVDNKKIHTFKKIEILQNKIQLNKKYNILENDFCELCKEKKVHSIHYEKNKIKISPGKAKDFNYYFICQHFIYCIDECIKKNKDKKIIIEFEFKGYKLKDMIKNTEITKSLSELIQVCYLEKIDSIVIYNLPIYLKPLIYIVKKLYKNTVYSLIKLK